METVNQFYDKYGFACKEDLDKILKDDNVEFFESLIEKLKGFQKPSLGKFASVSARDFSVEKGVSPDDIEGSGRGGKITKGDIVAFLGDTSEANGDNDSIISKSKRTSKKSTTQLKAEKFQCIGNEGGCDKPGIYQDPKNPKQWLCGRHRPFQL
jgi:pyruvate/2-oxoglutarate dehydrogenase complex dihydrolipoamide acyltransferase (E2) component